MVHFVGAGPGAADLITLRGMEAIRACDVLIYTGSLVHPALLGYAREGCRILDSARMSLEQVIGAMEEAEAGGKTTVRLHTGDPGIYGAVREQFRELEKRGIPFDVIPGVSSMCAAAACIPAEYTVPGITQTVIVTRMAGRTPVPERESIAALAAHGAAMVIFLSASMTEKLQEELLKGAYTEDTRAAIVYRATWEEERILHCTVGTLAETGERSGIRNHALILVGDFLGGAFERSRLYDPSFTTGFRKGTEP